MTPEMCLLSSSHLRRCSSRQGWHVLKAHSGLRPSFSCYYLLTHCLSLSDLHKIVRSAVSLLLVPGQCMVIHLQNQEFTFSMPGICRCDQNRLPDSPSCRTYGGHGYQLSDLLLTASGKMLLSDWGSLALSSDRTFFIPPQFPFFHLNNNNINLWAKCSHALESMQTARLSDDCFFQALLLHGASCRETLLKVLSKVFWALSAVRPGERERAVTESPHFYFWLLSWMLGSVMSILRSHWHLMSISKPSYKLVLPPSFLWLTPMSLMLTPSPFSAIINTLWAHRS